MPESGARPFERDIALRGRFLYTGDRLSSRIANARITTAVLSAADFDGAPGDRHRVRRRHLLDRARRPRPPCTASTQLQGLSRGRGPGSGATPGSASRSEARTALPHAVEAFDVAVLRGVLHHVDRPRSALREALRVAPTVVAVEPNGLNPGLKVLERWSRYHVEHGERSDPRRRLDGWVAALGASVVRRQWVGFVPMFSPDWYARGAKRLEPVLERTPLLRAVACAQYVFTASRARSSGRRAELTGGTQRETL